MTGTRRRLIRWWTALPSLNKRKNEKITYVSLKGLKESEEEQKRLSEEAVEIVKEIGGGDSFLSDLIESLITRNS